MSQSIPSFAVTRSDHPRSAEERAQILEKPGFGLHFTDHMVEVRWDKDTGWHNANVRAYGPLQLDPAAAVLHYGQEIFEGIKAYRHADGSIWTFRPDANGRRLQRSAQRLALPELPVEIFVESLKQLIAVDSDWVPSADESSLYFRPFMIGDEAFHRALTRLVYGTENPRPGAFAPLYRSTQDFVRIVNEVTGQDYGWFFRGYLYNAALPVLTQNRDGGALKLEWTTGDGGVFPMPVEVEIDGLGKRFAHARPI